MRASLTVSTLVLGLVLAAAPANAQPATAPEAPAPVTPAPAPAANPIVLAPPPIAPPPPHEPLAGYSGGNFFIRDSNDWFVVMPKGRLHIDGYFFPDRGSPPAGVENNSQADPRPKSTVFVRRARAEIQGTFIKHFDFHIAGEFASTPATGGYGIVSDCYLIVDYLDWLKFQAGQFNAPFMFENRTSNKIIDFMERSIVTRSNIPQNKDTGAMIFGWLPKRSARYEFGLFNGETAQAIRNQDNNLLILLRAFIAPMAPLALSDKHPWLKTISFGGSFWWQRNTNLGAGPSSNGFGNANGAAQDDASALTTQGGLTWLNTNYGNGKDAAMNPLRSHLVPDGETTKGAIEVNLPLKYCGLRFEMAFSEQGIARYDDANTDKALIKRSSRIRGAKMSGFGYYIEAFAWAIGDTTFLTGAGAPDAPRLKKYAPVKDPKWGLMIAAKYEHQQFDISDLPDQTDPVTGMAIPDPSVGRYSLDVFELGINAWATKHVRLTANYVLNYIDGDSTNVKKNFYYQKLEHELLFRLGLAI